MNKLGPNSLTAPARSKGVPRMRLGEFIEKEFLATGTAVPDVAVDAIEYDSRRVRRGSVFVALSGFTVDGHAFVLDAVEHGALAVVVERPVAVPKRIPVVVVRNTRETLAEMAARFYGRPDLEMNVLGVTGTNGKTTTASLVEHILTRAGFGVGLIGTIRYSVGAREIPAPQTTPESLP